VTSPGLQIVRVLGVRNCETEGDLFESGMRRIRDYLFGLRDYVRASAYPGIRLAVLAWNLSRTYDWRGVRPSGLANVNRRAGERSCA